MDPTNPQEQKLTASADNVSPEQTAESTQKTVPLAAVSEAREKARAANELARAQTERADKAEAELQRLRNEKAVVTKGDGTDLDEIKRQLQELREGQRRKDLATELSLSDPKQIEVIAKLQQELPKATPAEVLLLASMRDPETFKNRAVAGFDPSMHSTPRPTPGAQPQQQQQSQDDWVVRSKAIAAMPRVDKDEYWRNAVGAVAARETGAFPGHQKKPLK